MVQCVCATSCPDHWKPVCGSNSVSYDNHCELHRAACNKGEHVSPLHTGFCRGDREALIARQEFIQQLSLWDEKAQEGSNPPTIPLPDACFQNDRDRLREFIINWFQISAKKQNWYSAGMSSGEELWAHFTAINNLKDMTEAESIGSGISSGKLMIYLARKKNKSRSQADNMRLLCLDALVEEGDKDYDWTLNFSEFQSLLSPSYQPSQATCSLNGERFEDGAETTVECNGCVCACGKWVCTANICSQGFRDVEKNFLEDEDDSDQEENPEDDPHVQNIRWF